MSDLVDGLDDDDVDALLDRLADRADQRDDLQLPGGGASRRGVLAALLGAGGIGAAASQATAIGESESYGSSTGVAGTDSEPLSEANVRDLHAQDLVVDGLGRVEELEPRELSGGYTYAGAFEGGDPETRLDNALAAATEGNTVYLESARYNSDITLSNDYILQGTRTTTFKNMNLNGSGIIGLKIRDVVIDDVTITLGQDNVITNVLGNDADIDVGGDRTIITNSGDVSSGSITFDSGTAGGIVDAVTGFSVTDNGSNTVGDLG